jgi:hypothetical protein
MLDVADTISLHVLGKTHPRPAKKKKKEKKENSHRISGER